MNCAGDPSILSTNSSGHQFNQSESGRSEALTRHHVDETAHDLRSLVSNFKTRLYLAQRLPDQSARHMAALGSLVEHLDALVNKLGNVSRSGGENPAQVAQQINLNDIVSRVVDSYRPIAESKDIAVTFEATPDLPSIYAEKLDIARVVVNLLSNALNYTPMAGRVILTTSQTLDSVMLSVQDTGIGISVQALPHIFERSFRSEEARDIAVGTGLGLVIVSGIVGKYGWHIDVDSTPGKGSNFKVYFMAHIETSASS
jgi:signal transduction histidine kinase